MVYVRIELWPYGDRAKASLLQELTIANDGTGTPELGEYTTKLGHSTTFKPSADLFAGEIWRTAKCKHPRNLSPAHLVLSALKSALSRSSFPS